MPGFDIDTTELVNVAGVFDTASQVVESRASSAVGKAAADIRAQAQYIAPVDTGALRSSITVKNISSLESIVGPTVNYAGYVEYGTSRMGAQPYMRPAAEAVLPSFEASLSDILGGVL